MYDTNKRNIIQLSQQSCALGTDLIFLFINYFLFVRRVAFTTSLQTDEWNSCARTTIYCIIAIQLTKGLRPASARAGGEGIECTVGSVRPGTVTIVQSSATIVVSSVTTNSSLISRRLSGFSCLIC